MYCTLQYMRCASGSGPCLSCAWIGGQRAENDAADLASHGEPNAARAEEDAKMMLGVLLLIGGAAAKTALTPENFDEHAFSVTTSSFIKFYAPWCGHCKAMEPAWEQLGNVHAASPDMLIGEVDCTLHENLCVRFKVEGYPTIMYVQAGDSDMQEYTGEKTFEALYAFSKQVTPACTAKNRATCNTAQLAQLDEYMALSVDEREAKYREIAKPLHMEEEKLEAMMSRLERLEEKTEEQEELVEKLKTNLGSAIRLVKSTLDKVPDMDPSGNEDDLHKDDKDEM